MKILCLYRNKCTLELFQWLASNGQETVLWTERLDAEWCRQEGFDLTVSYTYRYLIPQAILDALGNNVVNLHNSVLPWNRGADPNIWSYLDNTPRGVTLHYMDAQLDKGHIIAQKLVNDGAGQTLQSSYDNEETTFILADSEAEAYLSERGYRFIVLHTDWRDMDGELDALFPILAREGVKRLFIDSYRVTEAYLRRLREKVETVYLDDINRFIYPVDALICYAAYWKKFRYEERQGCIWERATYPCGGNFPVLAKSLSGNGLAGF